MHRWFFRYWSVFTWYCMPWLNSSNVFWLQNVWVWRRQRMDFCIHTAAGSCMTQLVQGESSQAYIHRWRSGRCSSAGHPGCDGENGACCRSPKDGWVGSRAPHIQVAVGWETPVPQQPETTQRFSSVRAVQKWRKRAIHHQPVSTGLSARGCPVHLQQLCPIPRMHSGRWHGTWENHTGTFKHECVFFPPPQNALRFARSERSAISALDGRGKYIFVHNNVIHFFSSKAVVFIGVFHFCFFFSATCLQVIAFLAAALRKTGTWEDAENNVPHFLLSQRSAKQCKTTKVFNSWPTVNIFWNIYIFKDSESLKILIGANILQEHASTQRLCELPVNFL